MHVGRRAVGGDDPSDVLALCLQHEDGVSGALEEHSITLLALLERAEHLHQRERHFVDGVAELAELVFEPFDLVAEVAGLELSGSVQERLHRTGKIPYEKQRNDQAEERPADDEQGHQVFCFGDVVFRDFSLVGESLR